VSEELRVIPGHHDAMMSYSYPPSAVVQRHEDDPAASWTPERYVDVDGCEIGIARDDGCFVVLVEKSPSQWLPTSWIPPQAITALQEMILSPIDS